MTDAKTRLAEIRAAVERALSEGAGGDRFPARDLAFLLERIAHLEGLLKQAEFEGTTSIASPCNCPWCGRPDGQFHDASCPAFTPEGEIK